MTTSLKFFAAALISEMPPISIFSIIDCSDAPEASVSSKGYKSTITRSSSGMSYCSSWSMSLCN